MYVHVHEIVLNSSQCLNVSDSFLSFLVIGKKRYMYEESCLKMG